MGVANWEQVQYMKTIKAMKGRGTGQSPQIVTVAPLKDRLQGDQLVGEDSDGDVPANMALGHVGGNTERQGTFNKALEERGKTYQPNLPGCQRVNCGCYDCPVV